jgi:hypothetical protein
MAAHRANAFLLTASVIVVDLQKFKNVYYELG